MADSGGEKTEKASGKKREDERKKGNIFMSKDVTTVVSLITSFYIIRAFIGTFLREMQASYENTMTRIVQLDELTRQDVSVVFIEFARMFLVAAIPSMMIISVVSILATGVQTKFLFVTEPMKFKFSRLNPLQGIRKMFSLKSVVELLKSLIKITVIIAILYGRISGILVFLPNTIDYEIMQAAAYTGDTIMSLLVTVGIAFTAVAAADFIYQRWDYEKNIKMTKQEVKDEYKQMEGDPKVKSKRRQIQQEMAMNRMMGNVKEADVVVRNPTHYAVALRYNTDIDAAPIVLAKGVDHLAARIVEEAEKHNVATVENPPLARGLYAAADIEETIPAEFFQPVAELLAWIFNERRNNMQAFGKPTAPKNN